MKEDQTTWAEEPKKDSRPQREVRPLNIAAQPTRANTTDLLGQFSTYTLLKMNKFWALEICEKWHLIKRPRGSDKGPRGPPFDRNCDFFTKIIGIQLTNADISLEKLSKLYSKNRAWRPFFPELKKSQGSQMTSWRKKSEQLEEKDPRTTKKCPSESWTE